MKQAFITGWSGFAGRHMRWYLVERGWEVRGCDLKELTDANEQFQRNIHRYDLVVHCAYWVGGRKDIDGKPSNFIKNLKLDSNMFDWVMRTKQRRVLYFSSSAAYPVYLQMNPDNNVRLRENDANLESYNTPDANYGAAKLVGERLAYVAQQCDVPVTIVRPFSGYGPDQDDTYPFRAFLERAKKRADPFEIWGHAGQKRDWVHIDDLTRAAFKLAELGVDYPVNICTGQGTTMSTLAMLMCNELGYKPKIEVINAPLGVLNRVGDPTLLNRFYTPRITIEEGVKQALKES